MSDVGLYNEFPGIHFIKSLLVAVKWDWVSSGNSVSSHSVETRPFMLKPLRLPILKKPLAIKRWKQRWAVLRPIFSALAASLTLYGILPMFEFGPR